MPVPNRKLEIKDDYL